jgi:hypothetical protein
MDDIKTTKLVRDELLIGVKGFVAFPFPVPDIDPSAFAA